jgi:hypothetical protein
MSVLRPMLSRRGRLVLGAASLLLIATLVAAPSVGGARPASVKQFTASLSGGDANSLTMTITNCGGAPLDPPCTASSTIALGSVRIHFSSADFQPVSTPSTFSPDGRNWTASYDPATGNLDAHAVNNNKLQPGEVVQITWYYAKSTTCATQTLSTGAWGSTAIAGSDPFTLVGNPPTLNCVESGGSVTDPVTGQTDSITGTFTGHVIISFGGEGPDCGSDADFGALGDQWQVYHQATPSHVTPAGDFSAGGPKVWTTEFLLSTAPGGPDADSSWYLTCYAVPQDGHTRFVSRGTADGFAVGQTVGGVLSWVGILPNCADIFPTLFPCVSEQFLTTGPGAPLWSPSVNKVHIAITVAPGDPHRS